MNSSTISLFTLIKNNEFTKIYDLIKTNEVTDLDMKDDNYNYFIQYIVIFNQIDILKLILELLVDNIVSLRLDILDNDGRTILYHCIKFNYVDIIKLLINYNKYIIGISIIDLKDKLGFTALHYSIIYNNYNSFILLLENNANPYIITNDNNNAFTLAIINKKTDIFIYLFDNYKNEYVSDNNDNLLQIALYNNNNEIINLIIDKINTIQKKELFNLNNQTNDNGMTILHQSIIFNNYKLFKKLIENNSIDINIPDFYGNTTLHYILLENRLNFINDFLDLKNIKFNISNINGELPLHLILSNKLFNKIKIEEILENTDLNFLNNNNITCLQLLIENNLIEKYKHIITKKLLNIFICDVEINENLLSILIDSYFYQLKINKDKLKFKWEKECCKDNINIDICKNKIKENILMKRRSFPILLNYNLKLDNGIITKNSFYTGNSIDILFGLVFLYDSFKNKGLNIIINNSLINNKNLEIHHKKIGLNDDSYKYNFSNIEIVWSFQKIFYPDYFDDIINKKIKISKYIIIPVGIEINNGAHANILFWDIKNNIIERFEPNGANYPFNFNYNPLLLDKILENKFKSFNDNIKYIPPSKYLPPIGFQLLENIENQKNTKIGDPDGFCAVWCIWWIYQKMLNINKYQSGLFANEIIKSIKLNNYSFKQIIRNFSHKITNLRDKFLNKFKIDINDWLYQNFEESILLFLEKEIIDYLKD